MVEIWKEIPGYEGYYEISISGAVRGIQRLVKHNYTQRVAQSRLLMTRVNNCGYVEVRLSKENTTVTTFVHRLLALTFISNPLNKKEVNHINGEKTDNRLENLEWVTHAENIRHAHDYELIIPGCKKVIDTCTGKEFRSIKAASVFYKINYSTLKNYINGSRVNPTCLQYLVA